MHKDETPAAALLGNSLQSAKSYIGEKKNTSPMNMYFSCSLHRSR
jgi:hypothetical protein